MPKKAVITEIEKVYEEIEKLETDRHPIFFKHETEGRKRMSILLLKLNELEMEETEIYFKGKKT